MRNQYNVIDSDGHILEPLDLWDKYMDPKLRDRAPKIVKGENGKERLVIEEHSVGNAQLGIGRIGAVGARQGGRCRRHDGIQRRQARWVRSAQTHP